MEQIKLIRDGNRALTFQGKLLADVSNHSYEGPTQNRWTDVKVYETAKGKIVVGINHVSQWQGENGSYSAEVFASLNEAASYIEKAELPADLVSELMNDLDITEEIE